MSKLIFVGEGASSRRRNAPSCSAPRVPACAAPGPWALAELGVSLAKSWLHRRAQWQAPETELGRGTGGPLHRQPPKPSRSARGPRLGRKGSRAGGLRAQSLWAYGSGFRVRGLWLRIQGREFRFQGPWLAASVPRASGLMASRPARQCRIH